jgi:hypothetical protein
MDKLGLWKGRSVARLRLAAMVIVLLTARDTSADESHCGTTAEPAHKHCTTHEHTAADVRTILFRHWQAAVENPEYLGSDLTQLADYYGRFPVVVELLRSIDDKPWRLRYEQMVWATHVRGNRLDISSVVVAFDTRSAARLLNHPSCALSPACVISPADALLHELLHVQKILLEPDQFIAHGAGAIVYAVNHENEVIAAEQRLYEAMSTGDGRPRPRRRSHAGRLLPVACALCLPFEILAEKRSVQP